MKRFLSVIVALCLVAAPAWAAITTVTLAVPGMTCSTCPITVRKALTKVKGVTRVEIDLEKMEAVVTFDDSKTTVSALIKATTNAGYPSSAKVAKQ